MKRRTVLAVAAGAVVPAAGCLGSTGVGTPTRTDDALVRSGPGDYPHDITVHNRFDREVTLTITVDRGGSRIYDETHAVAAESGAVVAGITRATLPEGDRRLTLTATAADGESSQVDVSVTDCLGSVDFTVDSTGGLSSAYSIC